ncbi:hypothetical protein ACWFPY_06080 [Nocardia fluminea]
MTSGTGSRFQFSPKNTTSSALGGPKAGSKVHREHDGDNNKQLRDCRAHGGAFVRVLTTVSRSDIADLP